MPNELLTTSATEEALTELKSYNVTIPMGSLAIGVDNIHHDVFLSPKFVQAARDYLFDLIRQSTSAAFFPGMELRNTRMPDHSGFRKLLSELLQSALTQAKYQKNIEIDLVFRLSLLKFLTYEIGKLIAHFIGQKFQERQTEDQVDFDIFLVLGLGQSVLEQLGEKFAKAGMVRSA